MTLNTEKILISDEIAFVKNIFEKAVKILPSFNLVDASVLPYGLKAHTRSVSWIVEQVITQQAKFNAKRLKISDIHIDLPDTCLHDCIVIDESGKSFFINIKIHNIHGKDNKNDIAAVEKLYMQYKENKDYRLYYVCLGIEFDNINISFDKNYIHVFSPQFLPIYINPRNDKIQAYYYHNPEYRTRAQFLKALRDGSRSIVLS
jgi:hypothetical protein